MSSSRGGQADRHRSNIVTVTYPVGTSPFDIAISSTGAQAYVADQGADTVRVMDLATGATLASVAVGAMPTAVIVSADGAHACAANYVGGTVSVIDTATKAVTAAISTGGDTWSRCGCRKATGKARSRPGAIPRGR